MTYHWFGDSWPNGDELNNRDLSYPVLFSDYYNTDCLIHAENASSIPHMIVQFEKALTKLKPGDICFFGVAGPASTFVFGDKELYHLYLSANLNNDARINLDLNRVWYKYFDTPQQRHFSCSRALDTLKGLCTHYKLKCYFYNTICTEQYNTLIVNKQDWLIQDNDCVATSILHILDNEYYTTIVNDKEWLPESDWAIQKNLVEKYIHPNWCHPNAAGHQRIANKLIKAFDENTA